MKIIKFDIKLILIFMGIFLFLGFVSAIFPEGGNTDYYNFDESTGDLLNQKDLGNDGNLIEPAGYVIARGPTVPGILETAYNFSAANVGSAGSYINFTTPSQACYDLECSISVWTNVTSAQSGRTIYYEGDKDFDNGAILIYVSADSYLFDFINNTGDRLQFSTSTTDVDNSYWNNLIVTMNITHVNVYVNGTLNKAVPLNSTTLSVADPRNYIGARAAASTPGALADHFTGQIDELGIWDKALDQTEIDGLWNNGLGVPFVGAAVVLNSPEDEILTLEDSQIFNATLYISGGSDLRNGTLWIYEPDGFINNSLNISVSGVQNDTIFDYTFPNKYGEYSWNVLGCDDGVCSFASSNRSLTYGFQINNVTYNPSVSEGSSQNYTLNLTLVDGLNLNQAIFNYNGTTASSSIDAIGNDRIVEVSNFEIPGFTTPSTPTFYWDLTFSNGFVFNTTELTQSVGIIQLDDCSSFTYQLLNISLFDERTQNSLNGTIEIAYNVLNTPFYNIIETLNGTFSGVNNTLVCSEENLFDSGFAYSAEIKYYSDNYTSQFYNIQRADLVNSTETLNLYDLEEEYSTEFKITYQDNTFSFVDGAIIQLQRQYLSDNDYKIVEAPLTSNEGTAVLHIDLDSNRYRATIVKNGEVLDEFNNLVFVCDSPLVGDCTQKLIGNVDPRNSVPLNSLLDFSYSDPTIVNKTISISYSVPSGAPAAVGISLIQKDQFANETLCNQTVTSSAGSVSCNFIETIGNSYIDLSLTKNGDLILQQSYIIPEDGALDFLGNNFFIVLIFLLSLVGMAFTSPEWIIINAVITFVMAGALWLLNGLSFVVGLGSLMWLVVAAAILIFKIAKQEDR